MSRQKGLTEIHWEVLIIDNNSIDDTVTHARIIWSEFGMTNNLRCIKESQQGLTNARRRGIEESRYDCIVFCDDDNWLSTNYLSTGFHMLQSMPQIGIITGWSRAATLYGLPEWFEKYKYAFAVGAPHKGLKEITDGWQAWGAGMVTRRSVMQKVFDPEFPFLCTDRSGKNLGSGGDDEICCRQIIMGYKIYFNEHLHFTHFINPERLTDQGFEKLISGFEESSYYLKRYQFCARGLWFGEPLNIYQAIQSLLKAVASFFSGKRIYARCHLDSFAFAFRSRLFLDQISAMIFSFSKKYHGRNQFTDRS